MTIRLNTECFDLLLKHVPMESPAYGCLERAVRIYSTSNTIHAYSLHCMPEQLDEFLDAARKHFPDRVTEIEEAIAKAIVNAV
jgi:hypothetical protein